MKKNKFVKSTIILIIGGFITKILGMFIKIVITRLVGTEGIGLYMLINPTFMLFIAITTLGLPTAISKLISEETRSSKKIISNSLFITIVLNIITMVIIMLSSKYIAINLLKDERTYYGLMSIGLVLPFIGISSVLRGYFFGKEKMFPHVVSNVIEDIVKLLSVILFLPLFLIKGIEFAVAFLVLSNIISELASIIVLLIWFPNKKIDKKEIKPSLNYIKDIVSIGIPTTTSRLIGTICLFFEPIIITTILLKLNYSNNYIVNQYGIINGIVLPLILLPSFFSSAISQALLPVVSKNYIKHNNFYIKKKIKQAILFSLLIGIPATIIFTIYPNFPLKLIYNTNEGINYIKVLAPFCLLHYIQAPLTSVLQGINRSKEAMKGTLYGSIIKIISLIIFCYLNIGLWGLIISICINITYVTVHHILCVYKNI